jgi:hypothetical protein
MTFEFSVRQVAPQLQLLSVPQRLGLVPWPKSVNKSASTTAWLLVGHHPSNQ